MINFTVIKLNTSKRKSNLEISNLKKKSNNAHLVLKIIEQIRKEHSKNTIQIWSMLKDGKRRD
jgi:hypothetical protein